jgi:hypothetical protein
MKRLVLLITLVAFVLGMALPSLEAAAPKPTVAKGLAPLKAKASAAKKAKKGKKKKKKKKKHHKKRAPKPGAKK